MLGIAFAIRATVCSHTWDMCGLRVMKRPTLWLDLLGGVDVVDAADDEAVSAVDGIAEPEAAEANTTAVAAKMGWICVVAVYTLIVA